MRQMCLMVDKKLSSYDALLEAGFLLFGKDKSASLADVAAAAGVGRAALHRHFTGRDALMLALAKRALEELETASNAATENAPSYTDGLRLAMQAILPLAHRHMFLASERFDDPELAAWQAAQDRETHEAIDAAKAEGGLEPTLPTTWLATIYDNLIYAGWELIEAGEATPKQAANFAWRMFTQGATK